MYVYTLLSFSSFSLKSHPHIIILLHSLMYQVLTYYDIFVRNAFGNYRDILREIAHSPLMGENLSFLQSKSAAYMWENQQVVTFADENFVSCFPFIISSKQ